MIIADRSAETRRTTSAIATCCKTSRSRRDGFGLAVVLALSTLGTRQADARPRGPVEKGKIYTTAKTGARDEGGAETLSIIAIDPERGDWAPVLDNSMSRPRISPDGKAVAFFRGRALWVGTIAGGEGPKKILDLDGTTAAFPPAWSRGGKEIIVSLGEHDKDGGAWAFKTFHINADGTGKSELKLPGEDCVLDWSADGEWLLTASSRNAKIGWQLYVMRPDGTGQKQLTEGGNPFFARFSPDGRRLLYSDGTTEERRGIWVVGLDGKDRRKIVASGRALASACWSPDGTRIAVSSSRIEEGQDETRIEVMDLEGGNRITVSLPDGSSADMPDWR